MRRGLIPNNADAVPRTVVLIPAHDEAVVITETLVGVQHQLHQDAFLACVELWGIADNCNDATAKLARQTGAKVLERNNAVARVKGYALDYGLKHMAAQPPEIVVMIDADCQVHPGSIATLIKATQSPSTTDPRQLLHDPICSSSPQRRSIVISNKSETLCRAIGSNNFIQ